MWEMGRSSEVLAERVGTNRDGDFARSNISLGSNGVMGVMAWRFRQGAVGGKGGVLTMITACTRTAMVGCMYYGALSGGGSGYGQHGMGHDGAQVGRIGEKPWKGPSGGGRWLDLM